LAGFGDAGDNGKGSDSASLMTHAAAPMASATVPAAPTPRVQVLPARYASDGTPLPAQLAYLPPNVPDTLLLQEATP
jgi:hypothetical protein